LGDDVEGALTDTCLSYAFLFPLSLHFQDFSHVSFFCSSLIVLSGLVVASVWAILIRVLLFYAELLPG
jgi:hypothetical protein